MAKRGEINLGDEVKDQISGFTGIVNAITNWLNGCQTINVAPNRLGDKGSKLESASFDVEQLNVVKPAKPRSVSETGGPNTTPSRSIEPSRVR